MWNLDWWLSFSVLFWSLDICRDIGEIWCNHRPSLWDRGDVLCPSASGVWMKVAIICLSLSDPLWLCGCSFYFFILKFFLTFTLHTNHSSPCPFVLSFLCCLLLFDESMFSIVLVSFLPTWARSSAAASSLASSLSQIPPGACCLCPTGACCLNPTKSLISELPLLLACFASYYPVFWSLDPVLQGLRCHLSMDNIEELFYAILWHWKVGSGAEFWLPFFQPKHACLKVSPTSLEIEGSSDSDMEGKKRTSQERHSMLWDNFKK